MADNGLNGVEPLPEVKSGTREMTSVRRVRARLKGPRGASCRAVRHLPARNGPGPTFGPPLVIARMSRRSPWCLPRRRMTAVQDRLEKTYARDAGKTAPLTDSHRAQYLLSRLLTCACCGGGYTLVARDRYGCYSRKTKWLFCLSDHQDDHPAQCGGPGSRTASRRADANAVLRAMLGMVALAPDPDAPDRLRIEIRSSVDRCSLNEGEDLNAKGLPREAILMCSKMSMVAGAGFEPATFRL